MLGVSTWQQRWAYIVKAAQASAPLRKLEFTSSSHQSAAEPVRADQAEKSEPHGDLTRGFTITNELQVFDTTVCGGFFFLFCGEEKPTPRRCFIRSPQRAELHVWSERAACERRVCDERWITDPRRGLEWLNFCPARGMLCFLSSLWASAGTWYYLFYFFFQTGRTFFAGHLGWVRVRVFECVRFEVCVRVCMSLWTVSSWFKRLAEHVGWRSALRSDPTPPPHNVDVL